MKKEGEVVLFVYLIFIVYFTSFIAAVYIEPLPYVFNPVVPKQSMTKSDAFFSANQFSGGMSYSYPIKIPVGTHNLHPSLSLFYSSQNAKSNDLFGAGWGINLDYIQRNTNGTFTTTTDDEYLLSINGNTYELVYVLSEGKFHSKIESFLDIQNKTNGNNTNRQYWLVRTKDGTTYRFGFHNESELVSNLYNYTVQWSLDFVNDTYNNSIQYTYAENPYGDNGTVYLESISYNEDKTRTIDFIYESTDRPDKRTVYKNGNQVLSTRRLKELNITVNNLLVRNYVFEYTSLEGNIYSLSFLSNITEYGNNEVSRLPSTYFSYNEPKVGWTDDDTFEPVACFVDNTQQDLGYRFADVNGDGLVDVLYGSNITGTCGDDQKKAYIHNGTGWMENDSWEPPGCFIDNYRDEGFQLADVNGDGRVDVLRGLANTTGCFDENKRAWINNGTGWMENDNWEPPVCLFNSTKGDEGYRLDDVNGDGLVDILQGLRNTTGCLDEGKRAYINNGSGWVEDDAWEPPTCFLDDMYHDEGVREGDVNGDGLIDFLQGKDAPIIECTDDQKHAYINNGSGWVEDDAWEPVGCFRNSIHNDTGYRLADVNGDSFVDILFGLGSPTCGDDQKRAYINNGTGWIENDSWEPPDCFLDSSSKDGGYRFVDVNGDGIVDLWYGLEDPVNGCHDNAKKAFLSNATKGYLIKNITTEHGGILQVDYKQSTRLNNTGNDSYPDLGFNMWVVANITKNNGMTGNHSLISFTEYNYSGGKYVGYPFNEFRGFNYAEEKTTNKKIRHFFHQDEGNKSREYETIISDTSNNNFSQQQFTWTSAYQNGYYKIFLTEQSELSFDNTTNPRIKNASYSYDSFGNINRTHHKGEITNTNDDRYEYTTYLNNSDKWIVDKPSNTTLLDRNNLTVKNIVYLYDNQAFGIAPTQGSLASKQDYLNNGPDPATNYTYDVFGNVLNYTDANGRITQYIYGVRDTTRTYPDRIVNPKNHVTNYNYDLGTGNLLWQVDVNNNVTNYTYDVFGRITQEVQPYDTNATPTKTYAYEYDGTPPEEIKVTQREQIGTTNTTDNYQFYDGFNTLIQTKKEAVNTQQIVTDIFYDELGRIKKQSNPYIITFFENYSTPNSSIAFTNFTYDPLDRIIRIVNPDGSAKNTTYDHWNQTMYDERDKRIDQFNNAFGQIVEVREYNANELYITQYDYDAQNNLIGIKDSLNNTINFTYDSLSRKITLSDPDMGVWRYGYDAGGNLVNQTDNRNTTIFMKYDNLSRIYEKNSSKENITYQYDQQKNTTLSRIIITNNNIGINTTINLSYDDKLRKIQTLTQLNTLIFSTNQSYDSSNRVTVEGIPDASSIFYSYNTQALLASVHGIVNISYNEQNQPINRSYANTLTTNFTYNQNNFRLNKIATTNLQILNYQYDSKGNVQNIDDRANTKNYTMIYDDLDRLTYTNISDADIFNYTYNRIGNIMQIMHNDDNITLFYTLNQTKPLHAPFRIADKNTIPNDTTKFYIKNYLNEPVGWLGSEGNIVLDGQCFIQANCNTPGVRSFQVQNDSGVNVAFINESGDLCLRQGSCNDNYPSCSSGAADDSFIVRNSTNNNVIYINSTGSLCLVGGLTQRAGDSNFSNYNVTYDLNGNLIQDTTQYYEYNDFNQLVRVRNGSASGNIIEEYFYDSNGDRIYKLEVKPSVNQTTYYIGDSFIHVINASGKFNTTFYYADGVLVAEKDHLGNKKFYHPDHLGSTSLITNSSGQIIEETFYEPFGEILSGGATSRFDYNSKELDGTGLNYYGARYYKSTQSQFTQPDSNLPNVYNPQYLNRYSYVLNNPYKYVDPNGEKVELVTRRAYGILRPFATHSYLDITPDNPDDFSDMGTNFQIGAISRGGLLKLNNENQKGSRDKEYSRVLLENPEGMSDTESIQALIEYSKRVDEANIDYDLRPVGFGKGENSNSLVSSISYNVGYRFPEGYSYSNLGSKYKSSAGLGKVFDIKDYTNNGLLYSSTNQNVNYVSKTNLDGKSKGNYNWGKGGWGNYCWGCGGWNGGSKS